MDEKKTNKQKHEKEKKINSEEKQNANSESLAGGHSQDEKTNEYLEMAQRITAEFENYKKRNADLAKKSEEDGILKAASKMLPVVDAFDNAFKMVKDDGSKEGLKLIYNMVINALKDLGIEEIDALGSDFDPELHNAVIATEDKDNSGKVLEVYQKGFKMGDRIVRYSMVRVGK